MIQKKLDKNINLTVVCEKMIKADVHVHSDFSIDSKTKIESQIKKAIDMGLEFLCITDHYDLGYPNDAEILIQKFILKKFGN